MPDEKPKETVATQTAPEDALSRVPSKYRDLPADLAEELWQQPISADPEKAKEQAAERTRGLEALRARDSQTATEESAALTQRLETFSKGGTDVKATQERVIAEFIAPLLRADSLPVEAGLSMAETVVLAKMAEMYKKAKAERPNDPVQFQFSQPSDQLVFNNLVARQALESLKDENVQKDDVARERIQREVGAEVEKKGPISAQEVAELNRPISEKYFTAKRAGEDVSELFNQTLTSGGVNIDPQLGEQFDAHGIAKGMPEAQLRSLLNILDNGIDRNRDFSTAPLEVKPEDRAKGSAIGTSGGSAYKNGSFILLGAPGTVENPSLGLIRGGVKAVIVNDAYFHAIDRLQQAYPQVKFIRADKVNEGLQELIDGEGVIDIDYLKEQGKNAPEIPDDLQFDEEEPSTAETVKAAFGAMSGGIEQGALDKVTEYDQRIRAAQAGKPMKAGDTFDGLLKDFKFFTREDWTDKFTVAEFAKRRKQSS